MNIIPETAEGTTAKPIAHFTNTASKSIYGVISIIADGTTVYTSPGQLFGSGQTAVNLEWKTPTPGYVTVHQIQAKAEFYDKSFETQTSNVDTFPSTMTIPISHPSNIDKIFENGQTVAHPTVLYSSFKNDGSMRYKVVDPDGTCVIGGFDNCLVTQSTLGLKGNFKSIAIGDQIFRIRYSGSITGLERFSITSADPILGNWNVKIDSQEGLLPQAHAMQDVFLKVKYKADVHSITIPSK